MRNVSALFRAAVEIVGVDVACPRLDRVVHNQNSGFRQIKNRGRPDICSFFSLSICRIFLVPLGFCSCAGTPQKKINFGDTAENESW